MLAHLHYCCKPQRIFTCPHTVSLSTCLHRRTIRARIHLVCPCPSLCPWLSFYFTWIALLILLSFLYQPFWTNLTVLRCCFFAFLFQTPWSPLSSLYNSDSSVFPPAVSFPLYKLPHPSHLSVWLVPHHLYPLSDNAWWWFISNEQEFIWLMIWRSYRVQGLFL